MGSLIFFNLRLKIYQFRASEIQHTVCPRSLDPFYTVSYYMNWAKASWTNSKYYRLESQQKNTSYSTILTKKKKFRWPISKDNTIPISISIYSLARPLTMICTSRSKRFCILFNKNSLQCVKRILLPKVKFLQQNKSSCYGGNMVNISTNLERLQVGLHHLPLRLLPVQPLHQAQRLLPLLHNISRIYSSGVLRIYEGYKKYYVQFQKLTTIIAVQNLTTTLI